MRAKMERYAQDKKLEIEADVTDIIDHYETVIDDLKKQIEFLTETILYMEEKEKTNE